MKNLFDANIKARYETECSGFLKTLLLARRIKKIAFCHRENVLLDQKKPFLLDIYCLMIPKIGDYAIKLPILYRFLIRSPSDGVHKVGMPRIRLRTGKNKMGGKWDKTKQFVARLLLFPSISGKSCLD